MSAVTPILSPRDAVLRLLADLERPARLLVAISGGSDSTGLLVALVKLNSLHPNISITATTVDHALRPESAEEACSVAALCARLGIAHVIRRWQGNKPSTGLSAASREARYRLLLEVADAIDATAILAGHTLDDQAETIAMRAARGAGDDKAGLAGMAEAVLLDRRRWLLRPLLRTRRGDIRAFLAEEGFSWIDDPSNLNPRYERVRVRGVLAGQGGHDLDAWQAACVRRTVLSDAAAGFVHDHVTMRHGVLAHVATSGFAAAPDVRRYALTMLAALLGGKGFGVASDSMDRVMAFIDGSLPGRITAGRVIFDLRRDGLFIARENRGLLPLHVGTGETAVWDGRYRVFNGGDAAIVVGPTPPDRAEALGFFPDAPPAVAMRAMAVMPFVDVAASHPTAGTFSPLNGEKGMRSPVAGPSRMAHEAVSAEREADPVGTVAESAGMPPSPRLRIEGPGRGMRGITSTGGDIFIAPTLGPFDRFLPAFDLNLAGAFALLVGCDVFPRLPVKDSSRKS